VYPINRIAIQQGLRPWQVRDRVKVLARERGIDGRRGLTRLLNEQRLPGATGEGDGARGQ